MSEVKAWFSFKLLLVSSCTLQAPSGYLQAKITTNPKSVRESKPSCSGSISIMNSFIMMPSWLTYRSGTERRNESLTESISSAAQRWPVLSPWRWVKKNRVEETSRWLDLLLHSSRTKHSVRDVFTGQTCRDRGDDGRKRMSMNTVRKRKETLNTQAKLAAELMTFHSWKRCAEAEYYFLYVSFRLSVFYNELMRRLSSSLLGQRDKVFSVQEGKYPEQYFPSSTFVS